MARCIKSTADNSSAVAPQKILNLETLKCYFMHSLGDVSKKTKSFGKDQNAKNFMGSQVLFPCENGLKESCLFLSLFVAVKFIDLNCASQVTHALFHEK